MNLALTRVTGYELTRAAARPGQRPTSRSSAGAATTGPHQRVNRLVKEPVFVLSSARSGSTLLRVILNSHSMICAPHELHLRFLRVRIEGEYGKEAMKHIGLNQRKLENLLWDRVLERELTASGKSIIVDKTPNIVFEWERLQQAWPRARFIFLLRHPASIVDSLARVRGADTADDKAVALAARYIDALELARATLPGLTVRYEDLVTDPNRVSAEICAFLGVPWEPTMVDYGSFDHGPFVPKIGDWSEKIRSGQIDSNLRLPADDDVPVPLRDVSRSWGYLER